MTNGAEEWINSANPAGSGRYYALLHSDREGQQHQRLVATLVSVFSKLGFQSREIEVVKHKLDWWRQELEKESFSHPVMAAFSPDAITPVIRSQLQQLLNGYATLLESGSPSTDEQNHQFHLDTGATACHLLCSTQNTSKAVTDTGVALSRFRCLRYLRQHVDNGLLCLPMSSLDAAGISPALLTPAACTEEVRRYLAQELEALDKTMLDNQQALATQVTETPEPQRGNLKALFIYLKLQHQLLQTIRQGDLSIVEQVSRLTPIRNYWYAFRGARAFDKL